MKLPNSINNIPDYLKQADASTPFMSSKSAIQKIMLLELQDDESEFTPSTAFVYYYLLNNRNNRTKYFATSYSAIMSDIGISKTTLIKCLRKLEDIGLILTISGRKSTTNKYFFPLEEYFNGSLTAEYAKKIYILDQELWEEYHVNIVCELDKMIEERLKAEKLSVTGSKFSVQEDSTNSNPF